MNIKNFPFVFDIILGKKDIALDVPTLSSAEAFN
jgi:hypothetical protein